MRVSPASLPWFAIHELRLQWRDFTHTLHGRRAWIALLVGILFYVSAHYLAAILVGFWRSTTAPGDVAALAQITGVGLLFAAMSLSQAMESVTRAYYARADLDLIFASPASSARLFTVRSLAIAATSLALAVLLASPLINMLVAAEGPRWLGAYPVIAALALVSTACAIGITLFLFRLVGPRLTRFVSQVLAAVVGAALVVGIQVAIILSSGATADVAGQLSGAMLAAAPDAASPLWIPARAAQGDLLALFITLFFAAAAMGLALLASAPGFAGLATEAGSTPRRLRATKSQPFSYSSQAQVLRRKEWKLLWRDPWLVSQSLMQLLYLVPPAILLWMNFGQSGAILPVVVAVLVMAGGQLAGGLAWLTISGEDAHDLVLTAPMTPHRLFRAKIEAVMAVTALATGPLLLGLALTDPGAALIAAIGLILASGSATLIQMMFRTRARRAQFARRQTASRIATIIEAVTAICWAGSAGIATANIVIGMIAATVPALLLLGVWLFRRGAAHP